MILKDAERQTVMIVCERKCDGSRFHHWTMTSKEAVRLLRNTSPDFYRPLYLVRIRPRYA
jgi:hypothetical protein